MRTSLLVDLLRKGISSLEYSRSENSRNGNRYPVLVGIDKIKTAIEYLKKTNLFDEIIQKVAATGIFQVLQNSVELDNESYQNIESLLSRLKTSAIYTLNVLSKVITSESETTILIKLPPITDYNSFLEACNTFNKIFSQTILHPDINGHLNFEGVENGSNWLKLNVVAPAAVVLIGGMVWAAAVINNKFAQVEYMHEIVKTQQIENAHKEAAYEEYHRLMKDAIVDIEARHLFQQNYHTADSEQFEKLKYCLELLSKEMYKGAEVQPALVAPESVSELFPDFKNLPSIPSKVKEIENK